MPARSAAGAFAAIARLFLLIVLIVIVGCGKSEPEQQTPAQPPTAATEPALTEQQIQTALESAAAYIKRRDLPSAQKILETVAAKAPDDVRAFEMLGQVLYSLSIDAHQRGDIEGSKEMRARAGQVYLEAVKIQPQSPGLRNAAGMMLLMSSEDDAALEMFQSAAKIDPNNPQHPLYAAQILIKQKRYDEAEKALLRVLEIVPDEGTAYASLAVVAMERGDFPSAQDYVARARAIDPDNFDFRAQEARVVRRGGNPQRALEMIINLPEEIQSKPAFARELAAAYADLGQHAKASQAWQRVYQRQQGAADAWFAAAKAAELLIQAGDREQANIWLRQAELLAPHEELVVDLRKKLAETAP